MKPILMLAGILVTTIRITPQQRPPQFDMKIQTTKLSDNLYLLEGAGGNVAVYVWDEGALLVDDKLAPASPDVKAAVAAITSKPIRFVVNSHFHRDHSGGNEAMASDGSVIVAHENVRRRMSVDSFIAVFGRNSPASPPKALPVVTFTNDVTLHLGGEEISVVHVDPAHTDGDSFVKFRKANFLHMGDCFLNGSYPVIDSSSGGTFTGTIAAADTALGYARRGDSSHSRAWSYRDRSGSAPVARDARHHPGPGEDIGELGPDPRPGESRATHERMGG